MQAVAGVDCKNTRGGTLRWWQLYRWVPEWLAPVVTVASSIKRESPPFQCRNCLLARDSCDISVDRETHMLRISTFLGAALLTTTSLSSIARAATELGSTVEVLAFVRSMDVARLEALALPLVDGTQVP